MATLKEVIQQNPTTEKESKKKKKAQNTEVTELPDAAMDDNDEESDEASEQEAHEVYAEKGRFVRLRNYLNSFYDFRRNIVTFDIEMSKKGKNKWERLNENDLVCELYENNFQGIDSMLTAYLLASKYVKQYDPLKEYFESLAPYQETEGDLIQKLASFVRAEDNEFWLSMLKKHLVRTVANALTEIPFNKHCLTLLGTQDDGKTSFTRFLCPPALSDYIKDNPNLQNKDGQLTIAQNMILNLDELDQYSKYDVAQLKSAMTLDFVKERMPYDKKPIKIPRRASFFGSTNKEEFLTDETGNIRWIIVKILFINHDSGGKNGYSQININRIWAQALSLLRQGFNYNLTVEDKAKINERNKGHVRGSIEKELVEMVIRPGVENEKNQAYYMNATDVLRIIENMTKSKISHVEIGRAMKIIGFKQVTKRDSRNTPIKRYEVFFTEERFRLQFEALNSSSEQNVPY